MPHSTLKSLAFGLTLITASAALAAGTLTRRDTEAAGAIWGQKIAVETMINHCYKYVAIEAVGQLGAVLKSWQEANRDYTKVAGIIRRDALRAVEKAEGRAAAEALRMRWLGLGNKGRIEVRAQIDALTLGRRAGKCYGIMIAINEGKFDLWETALKDVEHLESRVKVMGW